MLSINPHCAVRQKKTTKIHNIQSMSRTDGNSDLWKNKCNQTVSYIFSLYSYVVCTACSLAIRFLNNGNTNHSKLQSFHTIFALEDERHQFEMCRRWWLQDNNMPNGWNTPKIYHLISMLAAITTSTTIIVVVVVVVIIFDWNSATQINKTEQVESAIQYI